MCNEHNQNSQRADEGQEPKDKEILAWRGACCGRPRHSTGRPGITDTYLEQTKWEHVPLHTLQQSPLLSQMGWCWAAMGRGGGNREEGCLSALHLVSKHWILCDKGLASNLMSPMLTKAGWLCCLAHTDLRPRNLCSHHEAWATTELRDMWKCFRQIQSVSQGIS